MQTIKFNASSLPVAASPKPVATAAKPIKVINLSQVQQKSLQEKLITNKFNQKVTTQLSGPTKSLGNFYDQNNNCFGNSSSSTTAASTTNNSNVKITKVVSSRSNSNLIYLNKNSINTGNFISTFNQNQLINGSNQQQQQPGRQLLNNPVYLTNKSSTQPGCPTMRVLSSTNQFVTKSGIAGPTTLSNTKMPKFYASPKIITAQYFNPSPGTPIGTTTATVTTNTSNHHINILNSNINRYLNQSKMNTNGATTPCAPAVGNANNSVTINPRFLTNLNSPNGSSGFPNLANNNATNVNSANNGVNRVNDYNNYFVEQDEDVVVDEEEELGHAETYANYMPSKCKTTIKSLNNYCFNKVLFVVLKCRLVWVIRIRLWRRVHWLLWSRLRYGMSLQCPSRSIQTALCQPCN